MKEKEISKAFLELVRVIKALRTPKTGCPWDLEQDHLSLRPYLIEEAYEVLQALESGDDAAFCDELGDLLLQVVLHAQIADDRDSFTILEIIQAISDKMVRRHPHVFGEVQAETSDEVLKNWETIKVNEKGGTAETDPEIPHTTSLRSVPPQLPALLRAQRLGEKAAKVNFDWSKLQGVVDKLREEVGELESELDSLGDLENFSHSDLSESQKQRMTHEIGDLLFSTSQLARWLGISSEDALRSCADRFLSRFEKMERALDDSIDKYSEKQLEFAWQEAKKGEH